MKKVVAGGIGFLVLNLFLLLFWVNREFQYKNLELVYPARLEIYSGMKLNEVLHLLAQKKIIRHEWLYRIYLKVKPITIIAGEYSLESPLTGLGILNLMQNGRVQFEKITIAEGLRLRAIFQLLAMRLQIPEDVFWNLEKNIQDFAKPNDLPMESFEGYLFPETYYFAKYCTAETALKTMVALFWEKMMPLWENRPSDYPYTFQESLILASIIEKETAVPDERRLVSSVFHNRLRKRMRLEACPTVQYLFPANKRLLYKDLETESPYNTYRYEGFPPGPICSPGGDSFAAALHPDSSDFLFFVATPQGTHLFAKDLKQHEINRYKTKRMKKTF